LLDAFCMGGFHIQGVTGVPSLPCNCSLNAIIMTRMKQEDQEHSPRNQIGQAEGILDEKIRHIFGAWWARNAFVGVK
jgi:hypothetical protein